ncbi:MAG: hydroxyacid dehydrogenase [Chloroflexota bacterium]
MPPHKILLTDGLEESGQAILRAEADVTDRPGISPEELIQLIPPYQALIVRGRTKVTATVMDAAPALKVIGRAGVGVDNIDLSAARARAIAVVNAPTATSIAVAELTFGLLLATARDLSRADAGMKQGEWLKKSLEGVELYGKTLGIIGLGRIGVEVGLRAKAFGMSVIAYDPLLAQDEIVRRGAQPVSLEALYALADFISLHLPLTPETRGMVDESALAQMKPGVRLVCAARGGIIDEAALLAALETGQVAAAGLDVYAAEPPGQTPLVAHPRLVATPHIGAQTVESQTRAAEDIAAEVLSALNGQPLRWRVV